MLERSFRRLGHAIGLKSTQAIDDQRAKITDAGMKRLGGLPGRNRNASGQEMELNVIRIELRRVASFSSSLA